MHCLLPYYAPLNGGFLYLFYFKVLYSDEKFDVFTENKYSVVLYSAETI